MYKYIAGYVHKKEQYAIVNPCSALIYSMNILISSYNTFLLEKFCNYDLHTVEVFRCVDIYRFTKDDENMWQIQYFKSRCPVDKKMVY